MENHDNLESLNINFTEYRTRLNSKFRSRKPYEPRTPGVVASFIPGTVVEILVSEGQKVEYEQELLVLDAMKMKNRILSPLAGTVKSILVKPGDKLPKGAILVVIE